MTKRSKKRTLGLGRGTPSSRRVGTRSMRRTFLLVTEGEETEPNYFAGFRQDCLVTIKTVPVGAGPLNAVSRAEKEVAKQRKGGASFDEVWCVFDLDEFPARDFNKAIDEAEKHGISVAYSVPCFELWFLLHFQEVNGDLDCSTLIAKLRKHLGGTYEKSDEEMYQSLADKQNRAIHRAERLVDSHRPSLAPARQNPVTLVHLLVKQLLANRRQ